MNKIIEKSIAENIQSIEPCWDLESFTNDLYDNEYFDSCSAAYSLFSDRIQQLPLNTWRCTDTMVGLYAYFFDGEFVAISWQPYRKSQTSIFWETPEHAHKVKQFIDTLRHIKDYNTPPMLISNIEDDVDACLTRLLNWKN
jgi:FPC/CPF motif-containing protein YcgG